jgi:hypothetical protein
MARVVVTPIRKKVLERGAVGIRDLIDTRSGQYARAFSSFNQSVVTLVDGLLSRGITPDELVRVLGATDFRALAESSGFGKALSQMGTAYAEVLANTIGRHPVAESQLVALQSFTRDSFLAKASAMPEQLKGELIKTVLGGGRTSDVEKNLAAFIKNAEAGSKAALANAQTEAATALSTFSRAVGYEMAKQDPPDTEYLYEGPLDDITRDICLEMAAAGALTLAEIEEQFPGAFIDGGGWNCRHSWEPADAAFEVDPEAAAEAIAAREEEGTWGTPLTARERDDGA